MKLPQDKEKKHKGKVLLINSSKLFEKGRPKNFLPDSAINQISPIYLNSKEEEGISKLASKEEQQKADTKLNEVLSQMGFEIE